MANSSPRYETSQDRQKEHKLMVEAAQLWRASFWKLNSYKYAVDFVLHRQGEICAFVEVKIRERNRHDSFPTYILNLSKWSAGKRLARETGKPFIILVGFKDGPMFHVWEAPESDLHIRNDALVVKLGGGTPPSRNHLPEDDLDIEPVVHIPMDRFRRLHKGAQ